MKRLDKSSGAPALEAVTRLRNLRYVIVQFEEPISRAERGWCKYQVTFNSRAQVPFNVPNSIQLQSEMYDVRWQATVMHCMSHSAAAAF